MTQENKELLLKDLCGRLPYGVKGTNAHGTITDLDHQTDYSPYMSIKNAVLKHDWKPYLFPLSSMTEEQKKEYCSLVWFNGLSSGWDSDDAIVLNEVEKLIEFYHKNHIDWRGLIPMGLANDATGLNIY